MPSKPLASAALGARRLELHPLPGGRRALLDRAPDGALLRIPCGDLLGAWGLWVTDVDGDGRPDLVITLLKKARFDPVMANRLHVYTLAGGQCVPLWRGTRLAGRFSAIRPQGPFLFVEEVVGQDTQRLARYRWSGFGYTMERVIWQGSGKVPEAFLKRHISPR